jgi:hypothetical protein
MAKKLIATGYRIDRATNSIYLEGNILLQRLLLITDVTINRIIYNFADEGSGVISIQYDQTTEETRLVCRQSFPELGINNADVLQVLIEEDSVQFRPDETFVDPVSKFRISQPENLIDTDFEYGLQTTKWETLKLVNNIPSFYSKGGAVPITVNSVQSNVGSSTVLVTAPSHGLTAGSPFEMTGLTNSQFEGGFIVTAVINTNQFTYLLSFNSTISQELATVYTACLPGAFYFGSQISVVDIETNGTNPSHLTVTTRFPHGFSLNTPFYFLNTVAVYRQDIPSVDFVIDDTVTSVKSTTSTTLGESTQDYRVTSVNPYRFLGKSTVYFDSSNIITRTNAPITSVRRTASGAGFISTPVATPFFGAANSNTVPFNGSTGVNLNGSITLTGVTTMQTGDRVEYHALGTAIRANTVSLLTKDPLNYISQSRFLGSPETTNAGDGTIGNNGIGGTNAAQVAGYSPSAMGGPVNIFYTAAVGSPSGILRVVTDQYFGSIQVGQSIQVFSAATAVLPVGSTITGITNVDLTYTDITIQFPFQISTAIPAINGTAAFYSTWIDPTQNTIRIDNHGFITGDRVLYTVLGGATPSVTPAAPAQAGPGGLTTNTGYFVIRVSKDRIKLATTYQEALQGRQINFTNIGSGTYSASNAGRFLPGLVFTSSSSSIFLRVVSNTTNAVVTLHPTSADATANTNVITFAAVGSSAVHNLAAGRAVLSTTITSGSLSNITVVDGGYSYDKNSSVAITAYQTQRSLVLPAALNVSGGTLPSGNTNQLRFLPQDGEAAIYANMLCSGPGFTNATVQSVTGPDVNGLINVQLTATNNAVINNGDVYTFSDPSQTAATAVPDIRVSCINLNDHGYQIGDPIFFTNPPGNTYPTGITPSRTYFAYPIDANNFALSVAFPGTGVVPAFTQVNSNARVAITTIGTVVSNRKFMMTRAFRITGSATTNAIPLAGALTATFGLTTNEPLIITSDAAATGTLTGVTASTVESAPYNNANHTIYYARTIAIPTAGTSTLTLSTSTGGAVSAVSTKSASGEVFVTPVLLIADSDSIYIPEHGFSEDDYVLYTSTLIPIAGLSAAVGTNGYLISKLSNDRIKLKNRSTSALLDLQSFGTGQHIFTNTKYSSTANTINKTAHGFLANQSISYDSGGNPIIDGLKNSQAYFVKQVNNNAFRVSDTVAELTIASVTTSGFGATPTAAEITTSKTMTVVFTANHGLSVGDKVIIANNQLDTFVNNQWVVSTVPTTPVVNGAASSITIQIPEFINSAKKITQTTGAMGIAYRYKDIGFVTANDTILTPVATGSTFTTAKVLASSTVKLTADVDGGGIATNHLIESSPVLPLESKVTGLSGTNIRNVILTFKQATISTVVRSSDVTTVTTSVAHGYADQQTVTITGVVDATFNTGFTPVVATVTGTNTFTYPNVGTNGSSTGGTATLALTSAQASTMAANGINSTTLANPTVTAQNAGALFTTATIATSATGLSKVDKTLVANAGLIGGTTLVVPDTTGLFVGMPATGASLATTAKIKTIFPETTATADAATVSTTTLTIAGTVTGTFTIGMRITGGTIPANTFIASGTFPTFTLNQSAAPQTGVVSITGTGSQIDLTVPHTAATTASAYSFYNLQAGQEVSQTTTNASTIAQATTASASTFPIASSATVSAAGVATNLYVSGNRATTTFSETANAGTSTFKVTTTDNTYTTNRVETTRFQLDSAYTSAVLFNSTANAFSNTRVFNAALDVNEAQDTITITNHPYVSGDPVKYLSGGTANEPTPLTSGGTYYVIAVDANTIQLASSQSNATAIPAVPIGITALGSGAFHELQSAVLQGNSLTGGGTLAVGMHVNITAGTGTIPQGCLVTATRTMVGGTGNRAVAFVISTGIPGSRIGSAPTNTASPAFGSLAVVTGVTIRGGVGSSGSIIYTNDTTNLAVGMVPTIVAGATAGSLPANTKITEIAGDGKSFTINTVPTVALVGAQIIAGAGSTGTTISCSSTAGLVVGQAINVGTSQIAGATGAFAANTRVASIIDPTTFTVTDAPTTALVASKLRAGVDNSTTTLYVPSATGYQVGQFLAIGTASQGSGTGAFAANTRITAIGGTAQKPTLTVNTAPSTALLSATIQAGSQSTAAVITVPTTIGLNTGMTVSVTGGTGAFAGGTTILSIDNVNNTFTASAAPTTALVGASVSATIANGVAVGMYVYSTQPNFPETTTVTAVDTGTNTVTINVPHGGVTSGNSVTFSPFAPNTYVTAVSALSGTAPNQFYTVTLNQAHSGILGGTAIDFVGLPPRTILGTIPAFVASNWPLRLEFPQALSVGLTAITTKGLNFRGAGKNLASETRYKTSGTHIFIRNSDADGVYTIEGITEPTKFTVRTGSFIPRNTKTFENTAIDLTNNWINVTNHKFRDGTTLIYKQGTGAPIGTSSYVDINGVTQTNLVNDQTYYAVVVDPNFIRIATSFDNATLPVPVTLDLTSGITSSHSFDTFSVVGLTKGIGTITATEDSDIIVGNGTKFLTNFKGGDILRFFTAANPGAIQNYTVASVKSDTSIKLRTIVPAVAGVTINPITTYTATGALVTIANQNGINVQTITLSSATAVAVGYYITGTGIPAGTKIGTLVGTTATLVKISDGTPSYLTAALSTTPVTITPVFEYFINTNVYVKSSATTQHRPFDGGVGMTTGLTPDSSIVRQTRKYFRYQSGKGIQVSMAINFNPPTDMEELTSSLNVATVRTDLPHGFKTGSVNTVRVSDAEVPSGHNGYNGNFTVSSVINDYEFAYVYENTPLIGKVVSGQNTITNIVDVTGVEVGKTVLTGTFGESTIAANNLITNVNTLSRTVTLSSNITGAFAPVNISTISRASNVATVVTTANHGLINGDYITTEGVTDTSFNALFAQVTVIDNVTFQYAQSAADATNTSGTITKLTRFTVYRSNGSSVSYGFPKYNLTGWNDAAIRGGLFDAQNGMYFEFDGDQLYCARRSSVQQIAGKINATYRSSQITGVDTKFTTQLSIGEYLVIRGMSYKVIGIESDTQLYMQPEYRGSTLSNIIGTKTIDTKVPQSEWSLDKCNGFGRSGYVLDLNRIQMCYIDYSWYGAGKVRFGFKDQNGKVIYVHEYIHNNKFVEAYMRSGNIPARYEVVTQGEPTFSPQLFHWGTSVIMDGRFDDDKAYLFTADSNTITLTNGGSIVAVSRVNGAGVAAYGPIRRGDNSFQILTTASSSFGAGSTIQVQNDFNFFYLPSNATVRSVNIIPGTTFSTVTLSVRFKQDLNIPAGGQNFIVGGGASASSIAALSPVPLVSIRLAPSVDNGLTGGLGFRDVMNRMQLTLNSCGVLLTHESEVKLWLNADLSDSNFLNNSSPSLSQLYKHVPGETIKSGIQLFSFRASGGNIINTTTGQRSLVQSTQTLGEIANLGNSILGGDEVFPNGPDILTITVSPIDSSTITGQAPFQASARITWSESQA